MPRSENKMQNSTMEPSLESLNSDLAAHGGGDGLKYGTAGFRAYAHLLPGAMHRIGVLAALRSRSLKGESVGAMVTASHNKEPYNGAKLVDPSGAMLHPAWEAAAANFVNAPAADALSSLVGLAPSPLLSGAAEVVVARDTRETSFDLTAALIQGVLDAGGKPIDLGVATTPQLHFVVRARHRREPSELIDYAYNLKKAFEALAIGRPPLRERLVVDCANGVGSAPARKVAAFVNGMTVINARAAKPDMLKLYEFDGPPGPLNEQCGADFVQKALAPPVVYDACDKDAKAVAMDSGAPEGALCASLDGDADRLVCYSRGSADGTILLADGDRFATLVAKRVARAVAKAGIPEVSIGVAQTAYSNGAATALLKALPGVTVKIALTGVKHLEKAVEEFDVGIYWEPNGHGTVLYSDRFRTALEDKVDECPSSQFLLQLGRLANQAVGDGVADLLIVVAILMREGMTFRDWLGEYREKCVSNEVVRVKDREVVETEDMDRRVAEPKALASRIAEVVRGIENVRAFVRPSGTEDVVRVFAEADTQTDADKAAVEAARAVFDTCDGVGDRP